tara:strand:+ start:1184 stop:2149 length:966 start_codon:yes stop_codon:yes gene_type:complete
MDINKIDTLVFSGGGTKGISFIGVIKYLEERGILNNIKKYVASSIGSVIASFLYLGYKPSEMLELLNKLDLNKLQDIDIDSIMNFSNNFGIDNGNNFLKLIKIIIKKKVKNENITLLELYKLTNKVLIITGTCLNNSDKKYFDYINTPNIKLYEAIRISTCFPLYFNSCRYNEKIYVDGALTNYYPASICEEDNFLGILINDTSQDDLEDIDDILVFIRCLFFINFKQYKQSLIEKYKDRTIVINLNANPLNFNLNIDEKQTYCDNGYKTTETFFKMLDEKTEDTQKDDTQKDDTDIFIDCACQTEIKYKDASCNTIPYHQ